MKYLICLNVFQMHSPLSTTKFRVLLNSLEEVLVSLYLGVNTYEYIGEPAWKLWGIPLWFGHDL
jgi:hypothetical protein